MHTPEKRNIVPSNPNVSVRRGKHLILANENDHNKAIQNETPKSFSFSGIISEMTRNGSVRTANDEMKITNENDAIGIQLTFSRSKPEFLSLIYTPSAVKPQAIPIDDMPNKI